jgi:hypothetical protein
MSYWWNALRRLAHAYHLCKRHRHSRSRRLQRTAAKILGNLPTCTQRPRQYDLDALLGVVRSPILFMPRRCRRRTLGLFRAPANPLRGEES